MLSKEEILQRIRAATFEPECKRPHLLFGASDVPAIRERARSHPDVMERVRRTCADLMAGEAGDANALQPYISGAEAVRVAEGYVMLGDATCADWAKQRVDALLALDTWFSPVHVGGCRVCDHVMANVGAHVALVYDMIGDRYGGAESRAVLAGLSRLLFDPFIDGTGATPEWWARRDMPSNWKIMTCGDAGLAVCAFAGRWPQAPEALARAARGVIEILDGVPPEGDWGEGVGYWFGTLWLGLRFARALRRLTGGAVNLFEHPALKVTGDFLVMLTTPAGRVYNFNDCNPQWGDNYSEVLAMLAVEQGREDWMHLARLHPAASPVYHACDDPAVAAHPPSAQVAVFHASGAASLRSGWGADDTFVGFKSGPSDAGHSHLDANSFLIESRGKTLVPEHAYWPQAHFLGFFDSKQLRWNFDGPGTVGHSTLLVDGQGQTWGPGLGGRILTADSGKGWSCVSGEAAAAYPGLLTKFVRTIMLIGADCIVVRDVVECAVERYIEWLLHYEGSVRSEGLHSVVECAGVRLVVTPFLPDRRNGWRVSDVVRASTYECSDTRQDVVRTVRYRSFSPFRRAAKAEYLFGMHVNGREQGDDWQFVPAADGWSLRSAGHDGTIRPKGDSLTIA